MLTIAAASFQHDRKLDIFINSVLDQTDQRFTLKIYHDGPVDKETKAICDRLEVPLIQTATRANQYGHNLRELALKECETEWLNWTNGDNYLVPKYVELMLAAADNKVDLVYCDLLHSYPNVNFDGKGPYNVLNSFPTVDRIDFANFIVRTEKAKQIGFPFRDYGADGTFINQFMAHYWTGDNVIKVNSVLAVHN